jgi:hypothetical protein
MTKDWRLEHLETQPYLRGAAFTRKPYRAYSATWEHDHCAGCWAKFMEPPAEELHEGYATTEAYFKGADYDWVCVTCFTEFEQPMNWTSTSNMPMTTLRIYDYRDGVLALDLRDLINLLAPRSIEASWIVSPVKLEHPELARTVDEFMMTGSGRPGEDQLELLAASGSSVSGLMLAEYAHATSQVIWGQFAGTLPAQSDIWVVIRAIDSTFYEVTTSDDEVLAKIKSAYNDVRVASGPVASTPIMETPKL